MIKIKTLRDVVLVEEPIGPLAFTAIVPVKSVMTEWGTMEAPPKQITYVNLEALPAELQERVRTALQLLSRP
jgi:hypothetical protein